MFKIVYATQAQRDAKKAGRSGLKNNIQKIEDEKIVKVLRMWTHYE